MKRHRSSMPAKPKSPSPNASVKSWDAYAHKLSVWKRLCNRIRSIAKSGKTTHHKKGKRR